MNGKRQVQSQGRGILAQFRRGLFNRNPLVLVAGAALLVGGLGGLELVVTSGDYTTIPENRVLRRWRDDYMHVSYVVARVKGHPPAVPGVYILGGSSARECIQSGETLEAQIRRQLGADVAVYDLGSTNQNLGQSMAIVDNLPPGGIVLVGINENRFTPSAAENEEQIVGRELLLKSPSLRRWVMENFDRGRWSPTILPGIISYFVSYYDWHKETLLQGKLPSTEFVWHRYTKDEIMPARRKHKKIKEWLAKNSRDFERNSDYNMALLRQIVRTGKERGLVVVLLELPENRQIIGDGLKSVKSVYRPRVRSLAAQEGVQYLDFIDDVGLVNTDFRDLTHLVEPGRAKWERVLARELGEALDQVRSL